MREGFRKFKRSVSHAIDGFTYAIRRERNFQIELVIAAIVIILIFALDVKSWEAIVLILMIMWVLVAELTNTVLERVVDILKPRIHPYARLIKDLMAAVVMISAIVAIAIGVIIFYPYMKEIFFLFF